MSARHHLSDYDRRRAVGRLEIGRSVPTVAAANGVSNSIISVLKKATDGGNASQKHAGGHSRNTTPLEDRYVALVAKRNRNLTSGYIVQICNRYRYVYFSKKNLTMIKSGWFVYTEACSLHLTSTGPSSREITLV
ncbi:hypothetical protein TNCV_4797881 [Trichonephila clavipes]|nr:hypothetical protein TNCV_4797881 [Trichonephila clavipes]